MKVFDTYAQYYDLIYKDKEYEAECDFIEKLFKKYSNHKVQSVLDLGCGTGEHAMFLACRGYDVTGVDLSHEMLRLARAKADAKNYNIHFQCDDLRKVRLKQSFDAVVVLFNVAGYQKENKDMHAMLATADFHLKSGGIMIFDFWFGPSVIAYPPHDRIKEIETEDRSVLRFAEPSLNVSANRVDIKYRVLSIKAGTVMANIKETHQVRFFFLPEIIEFLTHHQMEVIQFCKWMHLDGLPHLEQNWNACVVARKK